MRQPWLQAIFLDLDDTILAFSVSAEPCWQRTCEKYAPRLGGLMPEELLTTVNEVRGWFWQDPERHRRGRLYLDRARREIVVEAFARLHLPASRLAEEMADSYTAEREEMVQPFAGAMEALNHRRHRSKHLALITNGRGEDQRRKIDKFNLTPFFDYLLIEGEFGMGKPAAQVYLHALQRRGVRAEDT